MRFLDLKSAVVEIHQAIDQSDRQGLARPFFFTVGAGISHPPIPLASSIEAECREEAKKYGKDRPPSSPAPIDSYSYWFEQAYPQPENRQRYLRELMEKAFISRANFRLAHLLLNSTITNLVVTTNFDDLLSRALTLFGRRHIVCDHPRTLERIDLRSHDVQIIHVHGSYWFYDCCNLRAEIANRAKPSSATSFTMVSLLNDILWTRSPLVVGYSGWEGDVFIDALKRRMSASLRTNLYWFCYRRRDAQSLPMWLQDSPNVCVVVPDERPSTERADADRSASAESEQIGERLIPTSEMDDYSVSGTARDEPVLQATVVFDELIRCFNLAPPPLTEDPLGFFADYLKISLLDDNQEEFENDVYAIRSIIERVEKLRAGEKYLPALSHAELLLESLRNALRQSDHRQAIRLAGAIPLQDLTVEQLQEMSSALVNAASALSDNSDDELRSYDLVVAIAERLEASGHEDLTVRRQVARALVNKGLRLGVLNRREEAISAYDEVVRRFGEAGEPALREKVARALVNKGLRLGDLNRREEELGAYDEVVRRFGEAGELSLREKVAWALVAKGNSLRKLNRREKAIDLYDEVVRRYGDANELALRDKVAWALVFKGFALDALNRREEAIGQYEEIVRQYGDANEPALREQVARALVTKGVTLGFLDRSEEAIGVYDEVVRRFGEAAEPALRERVARALVNKGFRLGALKRSEEAMGVYDEVVQRFGEAREPALREHVARALFNKGLTLATLNRAEEAVSVYDEVVRRFGNASELPLRDLVAEAVAARERSAPLPQLTPGGDQQTAL